MTDQPTIIHDTVRRRFEAVAPDGSIAFLSYTPEAGRVAFDHTFVPKAFRGCGMAARLTRAALEEARRQRWRVVPSCSYVATFIERHPEYADLVV